MKLVTPANDEAAKPERESQPEVVPAPTPEDDHGKTAKDVRRERVRALTIKLLVGVALPTILAAIYYGAIATPQYESVSSFTVQSADGSTASTLELLVATVPGNSATRDSLLVQEYILSRDMLGHLTDEHDFTRHYAADWVDWYSGLAADAPLEDRYDYYREKVTVDFDSQSGVLELRVRAFSAAKAQQLATAIMAGSERMVNEMMRSARRDRIALAQREVDEAEERLGAARHRVLELQGERSEIDPAESASAVIAVRSNLESQLATARADLATMRATLQPGVPQLVDQQQRVSALARQVERQNRRLAGGSDEALSADIAQFEPALAEKEFAQQAYLSALKSLEVARIEADRQHRYLVTIAQPSRPDQATHPQILLAVLTIFVLALGVLGIGSLLLASIREHANI